MIGTEKLRGLIRTLTEHAGLQAALCGTVALNTLSNGVRERDVGQMVEAWMRVVQTYTTWKVNQHHRVFSDRTTVSNA